MPVDKDHPLAHQLPRHRFGLLGFACVIHRNGLERLTEQTAVCVDVSDCSLCADQLLLAEGLRRSRQRSGDPDLDLSLRRRDRN